MTETPVPEEEIIPEVTETSEPKEEIIPEVTETPVPEEEIIPEVTETPVPEEKPVEIIIPYEEPVNPFDTVAQTQNSCTSCCSGYAQDARISAENYQYVHKIQTIVALDESTDTIPYTLYWNGKPWYSGELEKSEDSFTSTTCDTCYVMEDHLNQVAIPGSYMLTLEDGRFCADSDDQGRLVFMGQEHSLPVTPSIIDPSLLTIGRSLPTDHDEALDSTIQSYIPTETKGTIINRFAKPKEEEETVQDEPGSTFNFKQYPAGIQIFIDDKNQGITPLIVTDVPPGEHTVTLETLGAYQQFIIPVCPSCQW